MKGNEFIGSSLSDFLEGEGILVEAQAKAIKQVVAWQIEQYIKDNKLSDTDAADYFGTSRKALKELLDEDHNNMRLHTMVKAVSLTGKKLQVSLV